MPVNWEDVRFPGDTRDVEELRTTYRIDSYLATAEENSRQVNEGIREQLMRDGIRLDERLSPRIYRVFTELTRALDFSTEAEIFCLASEKINAFAVLDVRAEGTHSLIGVTAAALERLDDIEIRCLLGHEIGHFLFGNNRLQALVNNDPQNPAATVLPALGESLFLRWRKKAEISADRVSLLGSGDFVATARTLLKGTFGLSERNLNLDIESLLKQIDEIRGHPELMAGVFASHPLLPIRLKALQLFASSEKAARNGYRASGKLLADDDLEGQVEELLSLTRRYPTKPLHVAVMRVVALGGAYLLGSDTDISDDEVKILVNALHAYFTDEPEGEIVTDQAKIREQLPGVLDVVRREGTMNDKGFILSRLCDIALADGALVKAESGVILEIAGKLDVPAKEAYGIMVGAAQTVGFKTDVKLNRIAEGLRRSLLLGLPPASGS